MRITTDFEADFDREYTAAKLGIIIEPKPKQITSLQWSDALLESLIRLLDVQTHFEQDTAKFDIAKDIIKLQCLFRQLEDSML